MRLSPNVVNQILSTDYSHCDSSTLPTIGVAGLLNALTGSSQQAAGVNSHRAIELVTHKLTDCITANRGQA